MNFKIIFHKEKIKTLINYSKQGKSKVGACKLFMFQKISSAKIFS